MSWRKSKFLKWEFWPYWLFYIPVYIKWLWLGVKAGSFTFFRAANPSMHLGGFCNYSKHQSLLNISNEYIPKMSLVTPNTTFENAKEQLNAVKITYPFILKPDKGERGLDVEKISNDHDLRHYLKNARGNSIAQEYVNFPIELGIMYSRLPSSHTGHIDSIVQKDFLTVIGNGASSLKELIMSGERTLFHKDLLFELFEERLDEVIPKEERLELVPIGNHCRGTTFLNANHLIKPALVEVFDKIWESMNGFYFGRFDIRVPSLEDLYAGRNIKIMEVNGAASEPAHIYDPEMSIWTAYQHLFKHWQRLFLISRENHEKGIDYPPLFSSIKEIRQHIKYRKA